MLEDSTQAVLDIEAALDDSGAVEQARAVLAPADICNHASLRRSSTIEVQCSGNCGFASMTLETETMCHHERGADDAGGLE